MRFYIGLSTSMHDPAMAIVDSEGEVVFAEATERYLQNKRAWHAPPDDLIRTRRLLRRFCPPGSELVISSTWGMKNSNELGELVQATPRLTVDTAGLDVETSRLPASEAWLRTMFRFDRNKTHFGSNLVFHSSDRPDEHRVVALRSFDHHLTHAAATCFSSGFRDAACAIIDGHGEGTAVTFYHYANGALTPMSSATSAFGMHEPSLGLFYSALCDACGFETMEGEEWKVMGLAAYGKRNADWYRTLRAMLTSAEGRLNWGPGRDAGIKALTDLAPEARKRPPIESADLAFTGQLVFEELVTELLRHLAKVSPSRNLAYGGGCALNSAYNGKIVGSTGFEHAYVFPAPADDGNAVGAALLAYYQDHPAKDPRARPRLTPYLGEVMNERTLANMCSLGKIGNKLSDGTAVSRYAAERLAEGKLVGWIQGRAEFGPRALGNRSILADPRNKDVKEIINSRVKFREEYRPFAPAILHEHGPEYFESYQETPYMERALRFRPEVADRVPGVVHVDGSGRLQSVTRAGNERYYDLIEHFYKLTGVPIVLNTSLNIMGKPIAHSVEDALGMFYTTGLDVLVIGDCVIEK